MKQRALILIGAFALAAMVGGCTNGSADEVVLLTHESFALSDGTLEAFTEQTGVTVTVRASGDVGSMVNQAILTKDNPIADVLYGIDNTFISRALAEGIFLPHEAASIGSVPSTLRVEGDPVTPIDFGDVCVNYDIDALAERNVEPPSTLGDLTDPAYRDLLVVQNPATSSPGLAFLFATIAAFPEDAAYDWRDYWTDLFSNGVAVVSDWTQAYSVEFTMAGGDRPLVVSYASSPPFEVLYGELTEAPTGVMTDGCFRQVEYAGVLAGTDNEEAARLLVDFLLSVPVQQDIPLNMFVYPANSQAQLPPVLTEFSVLPDDPVSIDSALIEANRERWIEEWTTIARS
jgi:thiamine transport system substrate-binding protein